MDNKPKKVLLVGMLNSVHLARWAKMTAEANVKFYFFPSTRARDLHPMLNSVFGSAQASFSPVFWSIRMPKLFWTALWVVDHALGDPLRGMWLRRFIQEVSPDYIHALEFQHAGYLLLRALKKKGNPSVIATNYGSDIYWFGKMGRHRKRITRLLRLSDLYSAECFRDVGLAKEFGFSGRVLPVMPNAGGFDDSTLLGPEVPLAERSTILVKGYAGWSGQADNAVLALRDMSHELSDYNVVFFSCDSRTIRSIKRNRLESNLKVEYFKKGSLSHEQMLSMMSRARLYLGVSKTDGISTSLLESIAMGAFPIQSSTSCANEWVKEGNSGLLLTDNRPETIARAISWSLEHSASMPQIEWEKSREESKQRLLLSKLKIVAQSFYA